MEIRLLGTPAIVLGSLPGELRPLGRRIAETVAILALQPERRISNRELSGLLFPGHAPNNSSLRSLIRRVRDVIEEPMLPKARHETRLLVEVDQVDYLKFDALMRGALAEQPGRRAHLLSAAVELWPSGVVALAGLDSPHFNAKRSEMEAGQACAFTALVGAELADGRPDAALEHARVAPPRCWDSTEFAKFYMTALAHCGHTDQLESVTARYEQRAGAAAPSSLLDHLADLQTVGADRTSSHPGTVVTAGIPRQLPRGRSVTVRRESEIADVTSRVSQPGGVILVHGTAGVGKTHLVLHAALACEPAYEDGTLYRHLRGFSAEHPEDPRNVLLSWLNALGVPVKDRGLDASTISTEDLAAIYRSELAHRSVLVVLDDARDIEQVRPLLPPAGSRSTCLITSRTVLTQLIRYYDATPVELEPLTEDAGVDFLRRELGDRRANADPVAAGMIVRYCAGLPLALSLICARLTTWPAQSLRQTAGELADIRGRIGVLDDSASDDNLSRVLTWSVRALSDRAAIAFRGIGVLPELAITTESVASVMGCTRTEARSAITELRTAHLLGSNQAPDDAGSIWDMHDILRAFAASLAAHLSGGDRDVAEGRVLDFALHQAVAGDRVLDPGRDYPVPVRPETVLVHEPGSIPDALDFLEAHFPTFQAAVRLARDRGLHEYVVFLPVALTVFYRRTARWNDQVNDLKAAREAAELWARPSDQALVFRLLGAAHNYVCQSELAMTCQRWAIRISADSGDLDGQARGWHSLGVAHEKAGWPDRARPHFERALELFEALGDERGTAHARNGMASVHLADGDLLAARTAAIDARAAARTASDPNGRCAAERNLARIEAARGNPTASSEGYRRARAGYDAVGYATAAVLTCGPEADQLAVHDPDEARVVRVEAIARLSALPKLRPSDVELLTELRASARADQGRTDRR